MCSHVTSLPWCCLKLLVRFLIGILLFRFFMFCPHEQMVHSLGTGIMPETTLDFCCTKHNLAKSK